jgi:hypothetical protein
MALSMEKVHFYGQMDQLMKEIGGRGRLKEEASIDKLMEEATKANGRII